MSLNSAAIVRLREVSREILAEPKKIVMSIWLTHDVTDTDVVPAPCDTVGCIAGWTVALDARSRGQQVRLPLRFPTFHISGAATEILGLEEWAADRLFCAELWPTRFKSRLAACRQQTPEYARVVVDRIEFFIKTDGRDQMEGGYES